ncbi:phage tail protein [uncultured Dysosmobacter sp.]|uniref:phage tail protein n=1 Tax=uncultured Dysosmobacter sp. TaxID=2591384 RepID=UPI002626D4D0|nr:phage tail protein [uncultured Dysosmobacter sp.]
MAIIGCLGEVVFEVSSRTVETIDNVKWGGSARYATHQRHGMNALTEFTGLDPDTMSFEITLSAYLGVDPIAEVVKIWNYERNGIAVPLVIGDKGYGKYRWSVLSHEMTMQTFDIHGNVTSAKVTISLQEYLRG